ncbi:MFS family major facilitator transporter, multidrug cation symporter [Schleiferilactobacillus perolens DSM 12744]|uniref:MFS family major facilitator transporter, multidrug cation symporter n=1 Tax=Schleiferilactobacillus perolens DSM 12744 TaxID=1423792 RepID=A0A0R1MX73_9LACO|nr:MFS family major facilitator transporter, multidrug cation symporter [Schleiferilactobacillus perolens DSM 12744]
MLQTALTTALPDIIKEFHVTANAGQWLTSGFSLAMGIMIPATAFLIKRLPTKVLFITSMLLFGGGSLLAAIAPIFPILLAGRIIQSLGTGILLSLTQVVILTIYPPEKQGGVMGIYGLAASAAPIIAPTITGLLIDYMSWRIIFWTGLVVAVADILLALVVVKNVLPTEKLRFDWPSFLLISAAFTGTTLGFGNLGTAPFMSLGIVGPLLVAVVTGAAFVYRGLHIDKPLLDLHVFKDQVFRTAVILSVLMYAVLMAVSTIFPIYVQTVHHLSATMSGLIMMPGALIMAVMSPITGRLYDRFGIRPLAIVGVLLVLVSTVGTSFLSVGTSVLYLTVTWAMRSAGLSFLMMPIVTWSVTQLSGGAIASASAVLTTLRTVAGAVGASVGVALMSFVANRGVTGHTVVATAGGVNAAFIMMAGIVTVMAVIVFLKVRSTKPTVQVVEEGTK